MVASVVLIACLAFVGLTDALSARLTHYCSYPPCCKSKGLSPPYTSAEKKFCGQDECDDYSGCKYQGDFAFCSKKSHADVINTNIVSFFSKKGDINKYKNKKIRVTQGDKQIDAIVCDTCGDDDCKGCCTENAGDKDYLIDMDANTYARFGGKDGTVTWTCLNC